MARLYRRKEEIRADFLAAFPNLDFSTIAVKSPWDDGYQCVACAECDDTDKSWPAVGYRWPAGLPLADPDVGATAEHFIPRFALLGYEPCGLNKSFELGYQKVAIYANDQGVTHMARQHVLGIGWLSKPGKMEDIVHRNLGDIEGAMSASACQYGRVTLILKRSWWSAFVKLDIFRCFWNSLKFLALRVIHGM
jgi:hypothetical protein